MVAEEVHGGEWGGDASEDEDVGMDDLGIFDFTSLKK